MNIEKAHESLKAADLCFQNLMYNSTANRAYYAMFQAAIVALKQTGITPQGEQWSHEGVQAMFALELTRQRKIFDNQMVKDLLDVLALRNIADYRDRTITQRNAQQALQKSHHFVDVVVHWIEHG